MSTICISANSAWYLYNFRLNTIRALRKVGARIVVAAPMDRYVEQLTSLGCEFYPLRIIQARVSPLADLRLFFSYLILYWRYRPEICFHFTIKCNVFGTLAARLAGAHAINNVSGLGPLYGRGGLTARMGDWLNRLAIRSSTHTFFQNHADMDMLLARDPKLKSNTSLIPGSGVDLNRFRPSTRQSSPTSATIFLFAARLLKDKGVLTYLQLAERLAADPRPCQFLVAGEPPLGHPDAVTEAELQPYRQLANVRFLGHRDDIEAVLQQVDCVVLPTRYNEGVPKILIESAACALPIICSNQPGCLEVVQPNDNGIVYGLAMPDGLQHAVAQFLAMSPEQRHTMGHNGRRRAESRFSESLAIQPYLDWLPGCLTAANRPHA